MSRSLLLMHLLLASGLAFAPAASSAQDAAKKIALLEKRIEALEKRALICKEGTAVRGEIDRWSPYSKCPAGSQATGLQRVDIMGDHNNPIVHVNDFQCNEQGCKAWCIGGACTVQARCCN